MSKKKGKHPKGKQHPNSLKNLRPPWKKGESGHPEGRPKRPISDAYAALALEIFPGDKQKRTFARLVAEAQFKQAIKGKTDAAREIADRLEGKAPQEITGKDGSPIPVTVEGIDEALMKLLEAAKERMSKK